MSKKFGKNQAHKVLKPARPKRCVTGYVYLIRSHQRSPFANTKLHKIGCSRRPFERIKAFQSGPTPISVIAVVPTWDMYGLEIRLHDRFAERRINGEWFALSEKNLREFNRMTANAVAKRPESEQAERPQPAIRLVKRTG